VIGEVDLAPPAMAPDPPNGQPDAAIVHARQSANGYSTAT
jgi:hypothetical protein